MIQQDNIRFFIPPDLIEPDALKQVRNTASMPFVQGLAVMPDVHFGMGSTVGTVVATEGAVMPACVGVDIGCGMIAVRTNLTVEQVMPHVRAIREGIERRIPVGVGGFGTNSKMTVTASARVGELMRLSDTLFGSVTHMDQRSNKWQKQLGSLGGGNHFIEVCIGWPWVDGTIPVNERVHLTDSEAVWVILHSGSRGVGNKTGNCWTKFAKQTYCGFEGDLSLPDHNLAALIYGTPEYDQYMKELHWCQEFARLNREEMMDRVLTELAVTVGGLAYNKETRTINPVIEVERINSHHNYVATEEYDGEQLLVTRKGAIFAGEGKRSLIPGSMGTNSYIVEGLGNAASFNSAPHGAGRAMSRTKARATFTVEQVAAHMTDRRVEARIREAIVDEAPGAYKDIEETMRHASELIRPLYQLRQIINVKGD